MNNDDLNSLIWPAMRYALGCSSCVVPTVCRAIKNNAKNIRRDIKQRMIEEIDSNFTNNDILTSPYGCEWLLVLVALKGEDQ